MQQIPKEVPSNWHLVCMMDISFTVAQDATMFSIPIYQVENSSGQFVCEIRPTETHILRAYADTIRELAQEMQLKLAHWMEKHRHEIRDLSKGLDWRSGDRHTNAAVPGVDRETPWPL